MQEPQRISQTFERPVVEEAIKVTYPSGSTIPAASTFIAGAVAAGTSLTCNGAPVHVSPEGFFAHVISLKPGENSFLLVQPQTGRQRELIVKREMPPPPIGAGTFKLDSEHLQPNNDRGVVVGDLIEFSANATPEAEVIVSLGKRRIVLRPAAAVAKAANANRHHKKAVKAAVVITSPVNQGLDAAYGRVYQRRAPSSPDLYVGYYKVQPDDQWNGLQAKYTLNHAGKSKSVAGNAKFTTIAQPILAETIHADTIVRVGPGAGRTTPLSNAVRFFVDGWQGDQIRCSFAPGHHFWIKKDDLIFEPDSSNSGQAPSSVARTINVGSDEYGATVTIPLSQRLPYQIEQHLKPNQLILRIFGATADTDWITPGSATATLVDKVTCRQASDGVYEVVVPIKSNRQWGFKADYDDTNLVLHVKARPKLTANSLQGLTICIDPGHGGRETGAIGCSGIKEATINLGIALKLKALLENSGARVIMTRIADRDVSLDERVEIANKAHADILLSVHNNSLPDGRDPLTEHGTSSYWYHPQSIGLARTINSSMVQDIGFPDFGSRFQNLALTRPSAMLATLAEVGFVINPEEYAILISAEGQQRAAEGILKGLFSYLHPPVKH